MIGPPVALAPSAPFPLVLSQTMTAEFVAPGMRRTDYRMITSDGPLVVHVVSVDVHDPTVRFGAVVAHDRMISAGETVSAMASRTHAVAGINADYFDITNTNQPLNVVVRDGVLERTPSKRAALTVGPANRLAIGYVAFAGTATIGATRVPLTTVNEWPPQGGVGLLTPAYGPLTAAADVQVAQLTPVDTVAGMPGSYRVTAVGPATAGPLAGDALGFGPAALRLAAPPSAGDVVQLAFDTTPLLTGITEAVGGGPLLVQNGAPVDDPQSPAPEERDVRFPVAGAARTADGTVLFIAVDGRRRAVSIGLTRPQFGALMLALGAADGMAFDSGGSATLVARRLGDAGPSVLNDPSDGFERPVADGFFAYSDAPLGNAPHLVVRPASFVALPGVNVPLHGAIVDDAGHKLRDATVVPVVADAGPGAHAAIARETSGAYTARVPYRTIDRVAALTIGADRLHPMPGDELTLSLDAADGAGNVVQLGDVPARWTIDGIPAPPGPQLHYDTRRGDGNVVATLGGTSSSTVVRVGSHVVALGGAESTFAYDLTGVARASTFPAAIALPGEPTAFALDVLGDGNGMPLRAAFVNRYGERRALTLAKRVDWLGWQHVSVALPPDLNPPVRLVSIYVVPSLGGPAVRVAGTLRLRDFSVTLPGMH